MEATERTAQILKRHDAEMEELKIVVASGFEATARQLKVTNDRLLEMSDRVIRVEGTKSEFEKLVSAQEEQSRQLKRLEETVRLSEVKSQENQTELLRTLSDLHSLQRDVAAQAKGVEVLDTY